MARIVVSDASPLIGLCIVGGMDWLPALFAEVWIPRVVHNELLPGREASGEEDIQAAIDSGWLKVWEQDLEPLPGIDLDEGESACIQLALNHLDPVLLIMDERAGRAVARENGLQVIGTAAIIGQAKKSGLIESARDTFEILHNSDFRISATVIKTVLSRIDEV